MRIALDTNVLAYSEGLDGQHRQAAADALIVTIQRQTIVIPVQVQAELFRILTGKKKLSRRAAHAVVSSWQRSASEQPATTEIVLRHALDLAERHEFQIFDAVILSASAESGCRMLLSEDMHDGFQWRGVTVVNPFAAEPHPLLAGLR